MCGSWRTSPPATTRRDPTPGSRQPCDWAWSDNAAIVLLAYLHEESGYGIRSTRSTSTASWRSRTSVTRWCRCYAQPGR